MDHGVDAPGVERSHRPVVVRQGVASADEFGCVRVDGLQAQLHDNGLLPVQPAKKLQNRLRQAVRPGGNCQGRHVRVGNRLGEQAFEVVHRGIGVGKALEIGDIAPVSRLSGYPGLGPLDLVEHRFGHRLGKVAAAGGRAEDTTPAALGSVPVGTCHAALEGQLIELAAEARPIVIVGGAEGHLPPPATRALDRAANCATERVSPRTAGSWPRVSKRA